MIVSRSVIELRAQIAALRQRAKTVGVVPTMGWLHPGHLELVRRAAADCDAVVMSIFVNPRQFDNPAGPRALPPRRGTGSRAGPGLRRRPGVRAAGGGGLPNEFTATVTLTGPLVSTLEGEHRGPAHFAGVTTVVSKLFNMVGADRGYFGEKDAQQLADHPIDGARPEHRHRDPRRADGARAGRVGDVQPQRPAGSGGPDPGGIAQPGARERCRRAGSGERRVATIVERAAAVLAVAGICPEYLAVVDEQSFRPVSEVFRPARFLVAAEVGGVRLIDNMPLLPG